MFLPDPDKAQSNLTTPKQHLNANITLSLMTIVVCLTLVVLNVILTDTGTRTPVISYVTWGFLIAMTAWHVQSVWRAVILRRHFSDEESRRANNDKPTLAEAASSRTAKDHFAETSRHRPTRL